MVNIYENTRTFTVTANLELGESQLISLWLTLDEIRKDHEKRGVTQTDYEIETFNKINEACNAIDAAAVELAKKHKGCTVNFHKGDTPNLPNFPSLNKVLKLER